MIGERHPEVAATILRALDENSVSHSIEAINICTGRLEDAGFVAPSWVQLVSGEVQAPDVVDEEDPNQPRKGWQATVSRVVETQFWDGLLPTLSNRDATLLRSQGGPLASIPFTVFPTDRSCRIDPQPFRVLLLRRLRLQLPLTARSCVCGRLLDNLGHHRSACSVAGILGRRGYPLETAAARICREAGGRVRTNVFLRDLDLGVGGVLDNRRLEVVVDGLPLFNGAQLAVDTTLVSPIRRDGAPRPRAHEVNGIALKHARRDKETTYPELAGRGGRARLVVLAGEVGGRFSTETAQFLSDLAWAKTQGVSDLLRGRARSAWTRRWSAMLGCAAARAFATSLLDGGASVGVDGPTPSLAEVMSEVRHLA